MNINFFKTLRHWITVAYLNCLSRGSGQNAKPQDIQFGHRKTLFLPWRWSNMGTGCPEIWSVHLWRYSKPVQPQSCAACSSRLYLRRGVGSRWSLEVPSNHSMTAMIQIQLTSSNLGPNTNWKPLFLYKLCDFIAFLRPWITVRCT